MNDRERLEAEAMARAFEAERVASARSYYDEIYGLAHRDTYRVPGCKDGLIHHVARMLRAAQRRHPRRLFRMSAKGLAASMNVTPATVRRRLDELVALGLLKVLRPGGMYRGAPDWKWVGPLDGAEGGG